MITWTTLNDREISGKANRIEALVVRDSGAWQWWVRRQEADGQRLKGSGEAPTLDAAKASCEEAVGPYLRMEDVLPHLMLSANMAAMPGHRPCLGILAVNDDGSGVVVAQMDLGDFTKDLLRLLGYSSIDEIL